MTAAAIFHRVFGSPPDVAKRGWAFAGERSVKVLEFAGRPRRFGVDIADGPVRKTHGTGPSVEDAADKAIRKWGERSGTAR